MIQFHTGYFDRHREASFVERARAALSGVDFDTMVGTGMSGVLAISRLAPAMHKFALYLRKSETESHSASIAEGDLGQRWIFVDDCWASGATWERVISTVGRLVELKRIQTLGNIESQYVGAFFYQDPGLQHFIPAGVGLH